MLYGDTNSTLAGAIAASKIHIPVVHIEAGLRSFNKSMPEEINRILCDHVASLLFSPTQTGFENLVNEGFKSEFNAPFSADNPAIYHCGDVMYDNSLHFARMAGSKIGLMHKNNLTNNNFILATIHRDNNTDIPERLISIFTAIYAISEKEKIPVLIPIHPRTEKVLSKNLPADLFEKISSSPFIKLIPPVSFLEMILLESNAKLVMTDSGGVQKEAYFFKKPCLILRPETEWIELVKQGTALITDADTQKIIDGYEYFKNVQNLNFIPIFGDGNAAEFISSEIIKAFGC